MWAAEARWTAPSDCAKPAGRSNRARSHSRWKTGVAEGQAPRGGGRELGGGAYGRGGEVGGRGDDGGGGEGGGAGSDGTGGGAGGGGGEARADEAERGRGGGSGVSSSSTAQPSHVHSHLPPAQFAQNSCGFGIHTWQPRMPAPPHRQVRRCFSRAASRPRCGRGELPGQQPQGSLLADGQGLPIRVHDGRRPRGKDARPPGEMSEGWRTGGAAARAASAPPLQAEASKRARSAEWTKVMAASFHPSTRAWGPSAASLCAGLLW
jgi:hypothetical protein